MVASSPILKNLCERRDSAALPPDSDSGALTPVPAQDVVHSWFQQCVDPKDQKYKEKLESGSDADVCYAGSLSAILKSRQPCSLEFGSEYTKAAAGGLHERRTKKRSDQPTVTCKRSSNPHVMESLDMPLPRKKLSRLAINWELDQSNAAESHVQMITAAAEPFTVIYVSEAWQRLCGFESAEAVGRTMELLQGPGTCLATLAELRQALRDQRMFSARQVSYTKAGHAFIYKLHVEPLRTPTGAVALFQHAFSEIHWLAEPNPSTEMFNMFSMVNNGGASESADSSLALPIKESEPNELTSPKSMPVNPRLELADILDLFNA
eukprot:CAMPEP_0119312344 /NCGR_PEP_ID=MMETSP1333-20130426/26057_1 /TAXON_ID=418940 /ORGANISM="Scyphosphaera apsteinii, Strain RCC1455" /LENGTH=321 /DNA_ID=CAMNT_0007316951 /DNA_START=33 /DNA_END=998 /DNA_ORIENTATION=+